MFQEIGLINYPVSDLDTAKEWYQSMLGTEPYLDSLQYVGFRVGTLNIGLNPNGFQEGMKGPVIFWKVDNIQIAFQKAIEAGAKVSREAQQLGPQILGSLIGADGILFGFIQYVQTDIEV